MSTEAKKNDSDLSITIKTTQGSWSTEFPKTIKVQEVVSQVVSHFGFATNGQYELRLERDPNTPLQPDRPLVSYGVRDGDVLIFTDLGIAV
jgi:hypothetical protein